jgi:hypothetical protein
MDLKTKTLKRLRIALQSFALVPNSRHKLRKRRRHCRIADQEWIETGRPEGASVRQISELMELLVTLWHSPSLLQNSFFLLRITVLSCVLYGSIEMHFPGAT